MKERTIDMLITETLKEKLYFSVIECNLADYILMQRDHIETQSTHYIANQLFTVPSTITRFCQKMGFKGFGDFKKAYLQELSYLSSHFHSINPNYPFEDQDECFVAANKIAHLYHEIIDDTLALIKKEDLQASVDLLKKANRIYVCSAGVQADLANTFKDKVLKIGKDVVVEAKLDECFYRATFCDSSDVFIMISYSGETETILRVAMKLKERHIPFVAITTVGDNKLDNLATYRLYVSTREKLIRNLGNFCMNLSSLFLLDTLYVNMFNDNFQNNFQNKVESSMGFEKNRTSYNPMIRDESHE